MKKTRLSSAFAFRSASPASSGNSAGNESEGGQRLVAVRSLFACSVQPREPSRRQGSRSAYSGQRGHWREARPRQARLFIASASWCGPGAV